MTFSNPGKRFPGTVSRHGAGMSFGRRRALQWLGAGCGCAFCGGVVNAQVLGYPLEATEIASKTWAVLGASEFFEFSNGGNIVNAAFIEVPDGVVVIDTGPSKRYGEAFRALIEKTLPGREILRVYNTHHHPDHFLGNQAFDVETIASSRKVIENSTLEGDGFTDNLYRLLGDWMRGTLIQPPGVALEADSEDVGGRTFSLFYLSGHTSADFVIRDDETGVLFTGDLAFLYRAPTTPHANIPVWQGSIDTLAGIDRDLILPGHGPRDPSGESLTQTSDYLDWLGGTMEQAVDSGLTMNEAMLLPIPERFAGLGVVRSEFERSVVHLYPGLEETVLPAVEVTR